MPGILAMKFKTSFLLASAASLLAAPYSFAQSQTTSSARILEEIIVTARHQSESLQTVPVAVSAFSGDLLIEHSVKTVSDLQQLAPNLYIQTYATDPNSGQIAMRGQKQNDARLFIDPSVGIYVDGVYQARTFGLTTAFLDLDRVEVLRGPQGTLYGRNTTGGAISLYTADPTDELSGKLSASYGNYDSSVFTGILNLPISESLGLRVAAMHSDGDGYGENINGDAHGDSEKRMIRAKLKYEGDRFQVSLTSQYQHIESGPSAYKLLDFTPNGIGVLQAAGELAGVQYNPGDPASPATQAAFAQIPNAIAALRSLIGGDVHDTGGTISDSATFESTNLALNITFNINEHLDVRSITGYSTFNRSSGMDLDGTPFNIAYGPNRAHGVDYLSQEFQLLGNHGKLNYILGVYAGDEDGDEGGRPATFLYPNVIVAPGLPGGVESFTDYKVFNENKAVFGQADYAITDALSLTAGVRYSVDTREIEYNNVLSLGGVFTYCNIPRKGVTRVNPSDPSTQDCGRRVDEDFSDVSWLVSVDYEFSPQFFSYAKVSRGFRSGGLSGQAVAVEDAFLPFDQEQVTEYEVGMKLDGLLNDRLRLNFAAYYDDYEDIQRSVTRINESGVVSTRVTNAAVATMQGLEAEGVFQVTENLRITATAGLTDAEYDEYIDFDSNGNQLDRSGENFGIPKWTTNIGARYSVPLSTGSLSFQADYFWQDDTDVNVTGNGEEIIQDSYSLLNGRIVLTLDAPQIDIAFFGRNLTDEDYISEAFDLSDVFGLNNAVYGPPRTYGIEFTKRFGSF